MKRLVIAVDCDDVLVESTKFIVDTYNRQYGTAVQVKSAHKSANPEWGCDREEVHRRINMIQLSDDYGRLVPLAQTIDAIKQLSLKHEMHVVTARTTKISTVTQRMLDRYFPGCFMSVKHVGFNTSKQQACLAVKAQILIDDNLNHLLAAQDSGLDNLLWYGDYLWQDRSVLPRGIIVTKSWSDVIEQIRVVNNE